MESQEYKIGIVDDEIASLNTIKANLENSGSFVVHFAVNNPEKCLQLVNDNPPDILLADYQMPKIDGLIIANEVMTKNIPVIFISGHPEKAIEGYEVDAVDFLMKPFTKSRLIKALNKAVKKLDQNGLGTYSMPEILVKDFGHKRMVNIKLAEILYFKGGEQYTSIFYSSGAEYFINTPLKGLEKKFGYPFLRVHKSYLININRILKMSQFYVELDNGERIGVGRSYKQSLIDYIDKYSID